MNLADPTDFFPHKPWTERDETALLARCPHLRRAPNQPGSLGEEIKKIERHLDRIVAPFSPRATARILASILENSVAFRMAMGGARER